MSNKPRVLVARMIFPDILDELRRHFDVQVHTQEGPMPYAELLAAMKDKDGAHITTSEPIDAALLDACPKLRAVCIMAVGYNNVDVAACTERGVLVTNTPDVLTETTADLGFVLMMAAARRITESEHFLRAGKWKHWAYDMFTGPDVHGATLGILGMGRIGQAVAKRGALGFDMNVIYHNRSRLDPSIEASLNGATWVTKDELMKRSDHLVIVMPYSKQTHHAIGAAELALMKPTATLTNMARGGIVDDAALAKALAAKKLFAAGLDVFEGEPQVHPDLLACDNVVLTPHIGSASVATRRRMAGLAAENLIAALTGGTPTTPVNPQVLPLRL